MKQIIYRQGYIMEPKIKPYRYTYYITFDSHIAYSITMTEECFIKMSEIWVEAGYEVKELAR